MLEVAWIAVAATVALTLAGVCWERHVRYTASVQLAAESARLAARWESEGQIQKAYRAYSEVYDGAFRIDSADMPPSVSDRILPLYRTIVTAHDDTLRARDVYRDRVGRYPDRLEEVQADIPSESLAALRGLGYERKGDYELQLVTGL